MRRYRWLAIVWLAGSSAWAHPAGNGRARASAREVETVKKMQMLFEKTVQTKGEEYLGAEAGLRAGGPLATAVLRDNLSSPDPVTRLIAEYLLGWLEGKASEYQGALDYLDYIPKRLATTPVTMPRPMGVANELERRFGGRVAHLAAVRLLKETTAPHWRILSFLFYLQRHPAPLVTVALIRFAAETDNPKWCEPAVEAIKASRDPDLKGKLKFERERLELQKRPFPAALAALESLESGH